ncbi:endolytic transglycosylase MltG [Paenibacillus doosanensis]|uniref:endolytic transglycosylase MltG n=1 Tax=Paenibacillus doosanensis TaxID=1229154 RepID=UPI00217F9FB9|nr:endolytic transglycosylase MltG [Paenibacillus doosanensis]MCS7462643.1 endolytic transglycosylase MltG [Paenibacillus doosanensis]
MSAAMKSAGKRVLWTVIIIGLAAVLSLGQYVRHMLTPAPAKEGAVRVDIPPGTGSVQIAAKLENAGLIRSASLFTYYLKYKGEGAKFQAGEYEMVPGMTIDAIIDTLNKGLTIKEQGIKLTVPEGYTIKQIADKIGQQFGTDPEVLLKTAQEYKGFSAKVYAAIPDNPQLSNRLEGYLFPETYEWKKEIEPQDMLDQMMLELDKKLSGLPADWERKLAERGQSFHQMMTVASLIEREVVLDEERPLVGSVIYNRLQKGMPLQIDATVQYLFDKPKERLYEKDLQVESPYNTYLHAGLPPGPIASPSLSSIKAAIEPADTKYLFYVTKKDGGKGHLFAETYEQHQQNIAASKKNQ